MRFLSLFLSVFSHPIPESKYFCLTQKLFLDKNELEKFQMITVPLFQA